MFAEIESWSDFRNCYVSIVDGPFESIWSHNLRNYLLRLSFWMGSCAYRFLISNFLALTKMKSENVNSRHLAKIVAEGRPTLSRRRRVLRTNRLRQPFQIDSGDQAFSHFEKWSTVSLQHAIFPHTILHHLIEPVMMQIFFNSRTSPWEMKGS